MRRYTVRINDTDHVLDVEELARDTFTVHLADGRLVDVLLTDHQDLAQAVIAPQLEIGHVRQGAPVPSSQPAVRSSTADHPAATSDRPAPPRRGGGRTVTSPMPGVILSIDVAVGAVVSRGQTLMVLEAMKMKNELKAERDGTVAAVRVSAGDQVRHGDALLDYES
jgi:glutaconyl-CoA decarboxylase